MHTHFGQRRSFVESGSATWSVAPYCVNVRSPPRPKMTPSTPRSECLAPPESGRAPSSTRNKSSSSRVTETCSRGGICVRVRTRLQGYPTHASRSARRHATALACTGASTMLGPVPPVAPMRRLRAHLPLYCAVFATLALLPRAALAKTGAATAEPLRLEVHGAAEAFYYKPRAKGPRPILMYLHGRNGNPAEDCRKWAKVATQFGWVVCPSGPGSSESGGRSWANGAGDAQKTIDGTIEALREKYKGRVQRRGNVLIGFSEGAFVAMQVGLKDQRTWTRWLILGASDQYWGGDVTELARALDVEKRKLRRVYLLTGENDGVAQNTVRVGDTLKLNKVPVKVRLVPGMGHEVPSDRMVSTYRRPLAWLVAAK